MSQIENHDENGTEVSTKDFCLPKRLKSPFYHFVGEHGQDVRALLGSSATDRKVEDQMLEAWRNLSEEEHQKWRDAAKCYNQRYEKQKQKLISLFCKMARSLKNERAHFDRVVTRIQKEPLEKLQARHRKETEEAQLMYRQEMDEIKAKHRKRMDGFQAAHQKEVHELNNTINSELHPQNKKHSIRMASIRDESRAEISQLCTDVSAYICVQCGELQFVENEYEQNDLPFCSACSETTCAFCMTRVWEGYPALVFCEHCDKTLCRDCMLACMFCTEKKKYVCPPCTETVGGFRTHKCGSVSCSEHKEYHHQRCRCK